MAEIAGTNLLGDFKHDLPEIYMDGSPPPRLIEFLNKLEMLMLEYRVSKLDICFKPSWEALAAKD